MKTRHGMLLSLVLLLGACSSAYYGTMEKLGVHKRDIMVDRVVAARDAQSEVVDLRIHVRDRQGRIRGHAAARPLPGNAEESHADG